MSPQSSSGSSRSLNGRCAVHAHQLGPDAVPVMRTEIPPHHLAFGRRFNGGAVLNRDLPVGVEPRPDVAAICVTQQRSKRGLATDQLRRTVQGLLFGRELVAHGRSLRCVDPYCQRSVDRRSSAWLPCKHGSLS